MIDPPRIANLLSAGQHNLNYFVKKRKIKCVSVNKVCIMLRSLFTGLHGWNIAQRCVEHSESSAF